MRLSPPKRCKTCSISPDRVNAIFAARLRMAISLLPPIPSQAFGPVATSEARRLRAVDQANALRLFQFHVRPDAARRTHRAGGRKSFRAVGRPADVHLSGELHSGRRRRQRQRRPRSPKFPIRRSPRWICKPIRRSGPFVSPSGETIKPLGDDEIILNSWAADDMAKQGVHAQAGRPGPHPIFSPRKPARPNDRSHRDAPLESDRRDVGPGGRSESRARGERADRSNGRSPTGIRRFRSMRRAFAAGRRTIRTSSIGNATRRCRRRLFRSRAAGGFGAAASGKRQAGGFRPSRI